MRSFWKDTLEYFYLYFYVVLQFSQVIDNICSMNWNDPTTKEEHIKERTFFFQEKKEINCVKT